MILNVDFAPTFLDYAGVAIPDSFQGRSMRPVLEGRTPDDWQTAMYYRYWMHLAHHHVYAHYGVRTLRYKLIYYYADALSQPGALDEPKEPEWELFDSGKRPVRTGQCVSTTRPTPTWCANCAENCAAYRKKWATSPMRGKIRWAN